MLIVCEPRFGGGGGGSSSSSSVVSGVTVASDRMDSSSESLKTYFITCTRLHHVRTNLNLLGARASVQVLAPAVLPFAVARLK